MAVREQALRGLSLARPWRTKFDLSKHRPFFQQHIISASQFDAESISHVMDVAEQINEALEIVPELPLLRGKVLASCFLELSTRTATSFHGAMVRLGGSVVSINQENSSAQKGETLEDTVRMLESCLWRRRPRSFILTK